MLSSKSKYLAELAIEHFFLRNQGRGVWLWTFTEPGRHGEEKLWTKDEAEEHFKPFRDFCARRGCELLVVWEQQSRGAWHPHCLVNKFFDVNFLRPWMVSRGWGPQMRVDRVNITAVPQGVQGGRHNGRECLVWIHGKNLQKYLTKYLTKRFSTEGVEKKKLFSATLRCKVGNTHFSWTATEKPGAYLYSLGRELFSIFEGRPPKFRDMSYVLRLGVETSGWAEFDPLWEFSVPGQYAGP